MLKVSTFVKFCQLKEKKSSDYGIFVKHRIGNLPVASFQQSAAAPLRVQVGAVLRHIGERVIDLVIKGARCVGDDVLRPTTNGNFILLPNDELRLRLP
jgi:hypothetical protein